ncbi:SusC/RagA family TonB-linked outer membrane protein [Sphingobacterium sp. LRF_L2]|uniref:SusC/RagA family TonB-linked outer membrane protein n=1 Tax=Sphingobacterium sp. LRF_L2 TaxID=3369421 RepID=UPI003F5F45D5
MENKRAYRKSLWNTFLWRLLPVLVLIMSGQKAWAQELSVHGVVKDVQGEPLIGVTVQVKGTYTTITTDKSGAFSIKAKSDDVLSLAYIGYESEEISIQGKTVLEITMRKANLQLNEVVVVGYGTQKKESVVGAISSINTKELLKSSSPNITQAIAGRLPGVITSQVSGAPGSDDVNIYIRGVASFASDNQPLIMVDGVERKFSQIAPDDIENISVLKDASATAVYGVRGANGVILITTKRGKIQAPTVSVTASTQIQTPTRKTDYLDSYQSLLLLEEALANDGLPSQYDNATLEKYKLSSQGALSAAEQQLYPNVDWYNEVLNNTAAAQRYNANIQGGTKRVRYFTSLEYYDQKGLYKNLTNSSNYTQSSNAQFKRYGFRANLDFLLTQTTTFSVNFGTRFEERYGPNVTENSATKYNEIFYEINHTPGWLFPVQYENGYFGGNSQNQNNIVAKLSRGGIYRNNNTINETNFILDQKLDFVTKGLSFRGMGSFDYETYYDRRFAAGFATYELIDRTQPGLAESYTRYNEDQELSYSGNTQNVTMKFYLEGALNYARDFGQHKVTGLLLYNQNDYRYQADLQKRYQGIVGRATYSYADRYLAEVNAGYNGSENFSKGNRFGFFPSMSIGWVPTNESFMANTKSWLDRLKFRASYGEVGNDKYYVNGSEVRFLYIEDWSWYNNVYYFGDANYKTGVYEGRYPNTGVTWERAKKYNIAFESDFFQGLFTLNVDLFRENRKNILTSYLTVPGYTGVELAAGNLGRTRNQGYEIEFKHRKQLGEIRYNVGFNFTHAKNKILAMDEPSGKPTYRRGTDHVIGQFFGLQSEGYLTQADIDNPNTPTSLFTTNVQPGDLKYKDMNGDGYIDDQDVTQIGGSYIPENTYAASLGVDYKGFSVSVMFQGVGKVSRYYDSEALFAFVNGGKVREEHLQRWDPNQTETYNLANAKYPLLHYDDQGNHNQRISSFFLRSGNYLRLKNVELAYNIPRNLSSKWHMSDCRVYVNANNLFTWDKLDGLTDPESTTSNAYPIMKSINLGLNIKF